LAPHVGAAREVIDLFVFGHVGLSIGAFSAYSWAEGKWPDNSLHQVDFRAVIVGAMLPDLIDKPLGLWIAPDLVDHSLRSIAHGLLFGLLILVVGGLVLVTRRSPRAMLLAIASSGHLALDRMWSNPTILLWPLMGWEFAAEYPSIGEWASGHLTNLLTFFTDFPELLGFLAIVGFTAHILRSGNLRRFIATGAAVSPKRIGP
jgi:hypothetical protein